MLIIRKELRIDWRNPKRGANGEVRATPTGRWEAVYRGQIQRVQRTRVALIRALEVNGF